ncbi:hypothetical protein NYA22BAC_00154 [Parasphingorhabdus sp. NYA22]
MGKDFTPSRRRSGRAVSAAPVAAAKILPQRTNYIYVALQHR